MPKGNLTNLIQIFGLTVLLGLAFFLDAYFAVSLFWQFNLAMAFLALLVLLPCFLTRPKTSLWLLSLFGTALFWLNSVTFSPLKPFVQFHQAILPGMSAGQVSYLYEQYFPVGGPFRRPVWHRGDGSPVTPADDMPQLAGAPNQSLHYTLDPTDGRFNSEWLIVYLKDGKVVGTEYLPD